MKNLNEPSKERISGQVEIIRQFIEGKGPMTVDEVMAGTGLKSPTGTSANIRSLRKEKYGSRIVKRTYLGNGLYSFELMPK